MFVDVDRVTPPWWDVADPELADPILSRLVPVGA
jgi:hypothetical protein